MPDTSPPAPEGRFSRRGVLKIAAAAGAIGLGGGLALPARAQSAAFPDGLVIDTAGASADLVRFLTDFFTAKTSRNVDATMAFFSPDLVTYIDATLGWDIAGFDAAHALFSQYMPTWPDTAKSYPTRIVGDMEHGAFVAFTDTPELFGGELRILAALDFQDGKIVRWIDHWDSRGWANAYDIPKETLTDYKATVGENASALMQDVGARLLASLAAGDAGAAAILFNEDAVLEDMALRAQILGRANIAAYLNRAGTVLPYGQGIVLRHMTGGDGGGAIEWVPGSGPMPSGVSGIVLDATGRIARMTSVYDGALYDDTAITGLMVMALPG